MNYQEFVEFGKHIKEVPENYGKIMALCSPDTLIRNKSSKVWEISNPVEKTLNNILNKLVENNVERIITDIRDILTTLIIKGKSYTKLHEYICHYILIKMFKSPQLITEYAMIVSVIAKMDESYKKYFLSFIEYSFYKGICCNTPDFVTILTLCAELYNKSEIITEECIRHMMTTLGETKNYIEYAEMFIILDVQKFKEHHQYLHNLLAGTGIDNKTRFKIMDALKL